MASFRSWKALAKRRELRRFMTKRQALEYLMHERDELNEAIFWLNTDTQDLPEEPPPLRLVLSDDADDDN